jgi:serine protease
MKPLHLGSFGPKHLAALLIATAVGTPASSADADALDPAELAPEMTHWDDESSWDIPGEYVVDFRDDVTMATIGSALSSLGVASFRPAPLGEETRMMVAELPARLTGAALAALRADPRVEHVEPHARVAAFFAPDDPMYEKQWHMAKIGAASAWALSVGRGVTVAVVDTGIACENFGPFTKASDLALTGCVEGVSFVRGTRSNDDHGHGTHVAGTIAQSTNNGLGGVGLAFKARLMPVKVLSSNGWGTTAGVAAGIRWAADHGAQVINLSLGGPRNSAVIQSAVDHARSRGAIVVAAAGNNGGSVGYPGASDGVIGVSATTADDGLAWFSSRGKGVDIGAPGVNVLQQTICDRGRNRCEIFPAWNGTSMASPHVAGAAALLVSLGVNDADAVERILGSTAQKLDDPGGKHFGKGRLRADAAVAEVMRSQLVARLIALLALAVVAFRWARRKGAAVSAGHLGFWLSALVAGVGAFFLPWLLSREAFWVDLLSRPVVEWDLLIGMSVHRFLPLANGLFPLLATVLLLRVRAAQPWLAGLSIGTGAYLASLIALGHLSTPFGWLLTTLWCGLNALFCLYLGALLLKKPA